MEPRKRPDITQSLQLLLKTLQFHFNQISERVAYNRIGAQNLFFGFKTDAAQELIYALNQGGEEVQLMQNSMKKAYHGIWIMAK